MADVPFNRPPLAGSELIFISQVLQTRGLGGDGAFGKRCEAWLEARLPGCKAMLTHSCTAALEMAMMLIDLKPGDEVIMPSFTFSSTANAVVLRGAQLVFADLDPLTMNIDQAAIEPLVTDRTRAIVPVHYAGRPPDMDEIVSIANRYGLMVIEDAAQSLGSTYKGRPAGTHGHLATLSFHETKNIVSGEGGALVINEVSYADRASILREKGTNRSAFTQGLVDKYTWVDIGSSYAPSEINAAFLCAQLEATDTITANRVHTWHRYRTGLEKAAMTFGIVLPAPIGTDRMLNGHIFHFLLPRSVDRAHFLDRMKKRGIHCHFHYMPLHAAPAGMKFGKAPLGCPKTEDAAARLVRLPIYAGIDDTTIDRVVDATYSTLAEVTT